MRFFDGNEHAAILEKRILELSESFRSSKLLLIVQIGEDLASTKYISLKMKLCDKMSVPVKLLTLTGNEPDIRNIIKSAFEDPSVSGGIIQLPLPNSSLHDCLDLIPLKKDLDILSQEAKDIFYSGSLVRVSPVVRALGYFIRFINLSAGKLLVIGDGSLVGRPAYQFLKTLGYNVTLNTNYKTGDPINADLVVLSTGVPNLVCAEDICAGCHVVDFGSSVINGKIVGDLCKDSSMNHLNCIAASPGGMGPLVVRFLLMNLLGI